MNLVARVVSLVALIGTITPALLFFNDRTAHATLKFWMLASTVAWFAATPVWMKREN